MKCVKVACISVCVQMDSLSFESFMESCLTGVGSLQDRLKLFALRSANASEVERWSRTHTWCPMILADCGLHHILSNTPTTTSYTHILICFNVHLLLCYIWNTHRSKMDRHRPQSLVYRSQWCKTVDHLSDKHAKTHANLQHMHRMYKHKHSNGAVQSFILYTHTLTHFVLSFFCCPPFLNAFGNS